MCRRCPLTRMPAPRCECGAIAYPRPGGSWICLACGQSWCEYITFRFQQGPVDEPVKVETPEQFAELFGQPRDPTEVIAKHAVEQDEPHPTIKRVNKHAWLKDHLWERRPRQEPPKPVPASDEWNRFCAQWREGDELWSYSYDGGPLAQRAGLCIVRDGEPVAEYVEIQS